MKQPDEIPRSKLDADDLAVLLITVYEAARQPYRVQLIGDGRDWVSVEVVRSDAP